MSATGSSAPSRPILRTGERVRVRTAEEILATLDENGTLDGLPLMPETLAFAGRELPVHLSAHKTCDTINHRGTTRRMDRAVHLTGARCDGSAHGGCQAGCQLFFKEEWLERLDGTPIRDGAPATGTIPLPLTVIESGTTAAPEPDDKPDAEPRYRCQATELVRATSYLPVQDWRQYVDDVRTGNVSFAATVRSLFLSVFNNYQKLSRKLPARLRIREGAFYPFYRGTGAAKQPPAGLDLQPGELVEVRDKAEIMAALGPNNRNRGLWFDAEMLPYAGRRGRVLGKVEKIVDESSGRMLKLRDCVVVDQITCAGQFNRYCPRSDYIYWREAWLRRVQG
ncbi:hypothetical protein ATK36_2761 [Amycolatopsis sulphurea]|uniref:Uncharacterized protein n=1 Tax=Amycolatopsis sulphurea TaxID=76022 RepID=A0A2A9F8F8_9PSEU|nr:hypothetical protein [Amycolatopsis sulphurea]PFG47707.1 hypothetical protein ATK36_2761 [Amycolatopsis sulphurea]